MRLIISIFSLMILAGAFFSCTDKEKAEEEVLKEKVMEIHDEIMPYMGEIKDLLLQVENKKATIAKDVLEGDLSSARRYEGLTRQLTNANEAMKEWMRSYSSVKKDEMTHEEMMAFLHEEKQKIENVKTKMQHAIKMAKEALEE